MRLVLLLFVALTACSADESLNNAFDPEAKAKAQAAAERREDNRAVQAGFAPDQPKPLATVSVDPPDTPAPGVILPPADEQYRYIGRWAANAALCETGAWQFRTRDLTTAGETKCDFPTVSAVPSGYRLNGSCQAEGRKTEQTLRLSFDETKRTMRVAGKTLGPVELLYCGN